MTALTAWLDDVLPEVPGCFNAAANQAILDAYGELCRRSLIYSYDPAAISVVAGTHTYSIVPPADTVVSDFLKVFVNSVLVDPRTEDWLDENVDDWRTTATGAARGYIVPDENDVRLVPTPAEAIASGLVVKVALAPLSTATTCPDIIFNKWRDAITAGALARLMMSPKKPYTNLQLGRSKEAEFNGWVTNAGMKATQAGTRARLRVRSHYS